MNSGGPMFMGGEPYSAGRGGGGSSCSMNSIRMLPGASTNTMRRVPNTPDTTIGAPHHVVTLDLAIEIVGEGRDVQEAVGGQLDLVLVDRPGEEGDLQRLRA